MDVVVRGCDLGVRQLERHTVVAFVDLRDHVATVDMLVVGHRNGGDVTGHFWCNGKLTRGDKGVVGRFKMGGVVPVEISGRRGDDQEQKCDRQNQGPAPDRLAVL